MEIPPSIIDPCIEFFNKINSKTGWLCFEIILLQVNYFSELQAFKNDPVCL